MKTILQINTTVNSGSHGRIAEEIGKESMNNGWKSFIAYGRNERPSKSELIRIGTDYDIKLHGMLTRLFDRHGFGSKSATINLIKQIEKINPDIIHLHNIHGYFLNIEVLFNFLAESDIPVVWTLHDCWAFTGHCAYFDSVCCQRWKTGCYSCPLKKAYPASCVIDNSKKNYLDKRALFTSLKNLTIVPVSGWLESLVRDSFLKEIPVQTISNGIDLNLFKPTNNNKEVKESLGITSQFMLLGVASIWENRKGLDDFIKLSHLLDSNTKIVLVGLNDGQLKKLPSTILGIKRTENISQLADLYSAADIVLNLSSEETFGMTTVEGFACGTPGIVYNCTASPELITPETGLVVEKGIINDLLAAINTIRNNGKSFYSDHCINRATKFYDSKATIESYKTLYNRLSSIEKNT